MATRRRRGQTVPVALRALLARVNRVLAKDGRVLKGARNRSERGQRELGQFYVLDMRRNVIVERDVDPEALARKLGALREYEHLEGE